jgi:hypothetical protein
MYCKYMHFGGFFVALEACLDWNDTSIMTRSVSMITSYISKKLILDGIADLSYSRSSITGKENRSSKSYI